MEKTNQTTSFTPGEWIKAKGRVAGMEIIEISTDSQDTWIAHVLNTTPVDGANANLIAAAPDMYAALKMVLMRLESSWTKEEKENIRINSINDIKAALTKATGGANL